MEVHLPDCDKPFQMKVCVISTSFDLPARASTLNTIQFNGEYGCNFCKQPGCTVQTERGGHVHCYPYQIEMPKGPSRTHGMYIESAKKAIQDNSTVSYKTNVYVGLCMHMHLAHIWLYMYTRKLFSCIHDIYCSYTFNNYTCKHIIIRSH